MLSANRMRVNNWENLISCNLWLAFDWKIGVSLRTSKKLIYLQPPKHIQKREFIELSKHVMNFRSVAMCFEFIWLSWRSFSERAKKTNAFDLVCSLLGRLKAKIFDEVALHQTQADAWKHDSFGTFVSDSFVFAKIRTNLNTNTHTHLRVIHESLKIHRLKFYKINQSFPLVNVFLMCCDVPAHTESENKRCSTSKWKGKSSRSPKNICVESENGKFRHSEKRFANKIDSTRKWTLSKTQIV